jgi:hypothetical protein
MGTIEPAGHRFTDSYVPSMTGDGLGRRDVDDRRRLRHKHTYNHAGALHFAGSRRPSAVFIINRLQKRNCLILAIIFSEVFLNAAR